MSVQQITKSALRGVKNVAKGYSDTQTKVRDATSNDAWGPSGMQMNEIAQLSYNQGDFLDIVEILYKRLNDKGKNWRHVFKSLTVLDYLLRQGSQNVVMYFRDNMYIIKTLREFQYVDEEGKDQGANVRQKAKEITNLLTDEGNLRQARQARADMRDRMLAGAHKTENRQRPRDLNKEDDQLRRAIEESKQSFAAEREERELQEALRLSKEEEEARAKALSESNARGLFDDTEDATSVNLFPDMVDPTPYAAGLQPQFTAAPPQFLQPQFTAMPLQPQYTSFNPFQQQMDMQQQQMLLQQQQQQQQQEEWLRQQLLQQQQQQQQEEWLRQQQMMQQQQHQSNFLMAQPTGLGSNNPFAAPSPSPSQSSPSPLPSLNSLNAPSFNLPGTYDNRNNPPSFGSSSTAGSLSPASSASPRSLSPQPQGILKVKTKDNENERLAHLLANRDDGQDTFGNMGLLRYGPGAGQQIIAKQHNAHNPFAKPQQQQQQSSDQPFFSL
ncbi:hypothetical protein BD626DRAFT_425996 [Schizophyllum amplum]|uniref:ENTH domain-containing protein n=1 Tax=Schizophyllum amplum TaxID=97359 RepID=A0A550CP44_9AGAR|nr:hypothetical protein BD626DRAFT_425996 [Auriculariopsis ampla]